MRKAANRDRRQRELAARALTLGITITALRLEDWRKRNEAHEAWQKEAARRAPPQPRRWSDY
ncbi:MAG TPA: hypothetical protein VMT99_03240 [Candidatus Paceibacterota bacterium]|nr:hypothetical protein [Candidatus Paceibacterota bacterium]